MRFISILLIVLTLSAFAGNKFIGFNKTTAEYSAELAKPNLESRLKSRYITILYKLSGGELTIEYLNSVYAPKDRADYILLCKEYKLGFIKSLLTNPDVMTASGKWSILYYEKDLNLNLTNEQRLQYCADILCSDSLKTVNVLQKVLDIYIPGSINSSDEIVVPVLKKAYLINVQRLDNQAYKPIVLRISLALKARGIEVK